MIYENFKTAAKLFISIQIVLISIFTRTYLGLQVYGYRLGEMIVGSLLLFSFIVIFFNSKNLKENKDSNKYFLIILLFTLFLFFNNKSELFNLNIYKRSSFVWLISSIFLGIYLQKNIDLISTIKYFYPTIPVIVYVFNSGNYPDVLIRFFNSYSDKFQFTKGADIVLILLISFLVVRVNFGPKYSGQYLFIVSMLILPLLQVLSRAAFISLIVGNILLIWQDFKLIIRHKKFYLLTFFLGTLVILMSYIKIADVSFNLLEINETTEVVNQSIKEVSKAKDTKKVFLSFYFENNRLISKDPTTNWRLDIWQDLFVDMYQNKKLVFGYGFNDIVPVMTDPTAPGRLGRDGLNEHVHNHFLTIFARGGIFYLFLFIYFYLSILKHLNSKFVDKSYRILFLPIFLIAMFDITMDGVQHPFLFFFFTGLFIAFNNKSFNIENNE